MTDRYKVTNIRESITPRDMADVLEVIQRARVLAVDQQSVGKARSYFALMDSYERHLFNHMVTIEKIADQ